MKINLNNVIKDLRIKHGYTQAYVAQKLKISTSAYGRYESGKSKPKFVTFIAIAKFYNVSTDFLLSRYDT